MSTNRTTIRSAGIAALAAFALGAFTGPAMAQSQEEIGMMSGPDRMAKLIAGAKKEGQVTFYTSLLVNSGVRPLKKAIETKYPFLKFEYVRSSTNPLIQKILSEARAGKTQSDASAGSGSALLKKAGAIVPYKTPGQAAFPKEYIPDDNMWTSFRMSYNGIGYNTKLVSKEEAPKSWEDLLDPKWKGKMVWQKATQTGGPLTVLHLQRIWGKKKAAEFFEKLAKQDVAASNASGRAVMDLVIAGEYHISIAAALHHVTRSQHKGAQADFVSPDPVISRPGDLTFIKGAPHPNAGMLLIDYIISKEGQELLAKHEYLVAHPDVEPLPYMKPIVPHLNGKKEIIYTPEVVQAASKEIIAIYKSVSK